MQMMKEKTQRFFKKFTLLSQALTISGYMFKGMAKKLSYLKITYLDIRPSSSLAPHSILIFDGCLAVISFLISIFLVIGSEFFNYSQAYIFKLIFVFVLTSLSVFLWMQTHKTFWRYFSLEDCIPLALAVFLSTLLYIPMLLMLSHQEALPKSVPFIQFLIYVSLLCLSRYSFKMITDYRAKQQRRLLKDQAVPVLLVGSGFATDFFIREVMHSPALSFNPIGIISPDISEKNRRIHTVRILGTGEPTKEFIHEIRSLSQRPQQMIITEAELPNDFLLHIVELSQKLSLPIMQLVTQFSLIKKNYPKENFDLNEPLFQKSASNI